MNTQGENQCLMQSPHTGSLLSSSSADCFVTSYSIMTEYCIILLLHTAL